ncbi:hypothetical protein QJ054_34585, partial [Streptomyces sp. AN-3]|uniref:hypothetical protein n=1 Tax=Streptomyces sp. AN-3 TaxID=3044177 RepID=UPI00249BB9EB
KRAVRATRRKNLKSPEEMSRTETVVPLQRITDADHASDDEIHGRLNKPDRALAYPSGHASNLNSRPAAEELFS